QARTGRMFWSAVFWSVAVAFSVAARKRNDGRQVGCCHTEAVRLDSGDLNEQARRVRAILDSGGLAQVDIFCSGNLTRLTMGGCWATAYPLTISPRLQALVAQVDRASR
nr:hypothetical protein [Gammaproteobacteria bacterium]